VSLRQSQRHWQLLRFDVQPVHLAGNGAVAHPARCLSSANETDYYNIKDVMFGYIPCDENPVITEKVRTDTAC
jgi:hypothetical protein